MTTKTIAVLSDVHSNVYALDAVLSDIARRGIDTVVNLGDTLFGPVAPVESAKRLMERSDIVSIMGNCDRALLQEESPSLTFQQVKPLLTQEMLEWIRTFRNAWVFEDILFCHGTPFSDEQYLLEEVNERGATAKNVLEVAELLREVPQSIVVCGHTHLPRCVHLPDGKLVLNPGSVGFPAYYEDAPYPHVMEAMSPHARYAILRQTKNGWGIEQVMLPYDWEQAAKLAEKAGRPDYSHAIRTGFAYIPAE
ncbi:metallophosphoesterase family protein [Brevibacillus brevis]|uniref:Metallophosphoesterase family protein n=1 Tax=Brevibacillus brevis TaxID=1393 RepID=A0ABY9T3A0_BREBE|nr:metallophosphoesterase family protein [Brevibacillus brevis]WNC14388.1 metallophosphoesterase family protein [Brevibacillus brevis]